MNRENRYFVFKIKDVEKYMDKEQQQDLRRLLDMVDVGRYFDKKDKLDCVVVEKDWPEYEPVWQMIEKRVDGKRK